jgi:hypothetical protein
MKHRYFSYDPDGDDFKTHATAEEAKQAAQDAIDISIDGNEWAEFVDQICWGEIREQSTQCDVKKREDCDEDEYFPEGCDYMCNYRLEATHDPA